MKDVYPIIWAGVDWTLKIALLNMLWIGTTLLGGIIFGIFPATVALYAVVRQLLLKKKEMGEIYQLFWTYYKTEFRKSNSLGLVITGLAVIFTVNILFYLGMNNEISQVLMSFFSILLIALSLITLFIFPLYTNLQLTIKDYLKLGSLLMITNPVTNLLMFLSLIGVLFILLHIPMFMPFFSVSGIVIILSLLTRKSMVNVIDKLNIQEN